ncbi:hypothetical protein KFK09_008170 [Dendrobium nobile]|uniref:Uncharacterized protein n=1 Tax=Dendrobium nobile TaxID=94219 RepID=A0A8T3BMD9_DENNO|nr:hypothetical protein KFK09_008170 [Dendrobium nobile]
MKSSVPSGAREPEREGRGRGSPGISGTEKDRASGRGPRPLAFHLGLLQDRENERAVTCLVLLDSANPKKQKGSHAI